MWVRESVLIWIWSVFSWNPLKTTVRLEGLPFDPIVAWKQQQQKRKQQLQTMFSKKERKRKRKDVGKMKAQVENRKSAWGGNWSPMRWEEAASMAPLLQFPCLFTDFPFVFFAFCNLSSFFYIFATFIWFHKTLFLRTLFVVCFEYFKTWFFFFF